MKEHDAFEQAYKNGRDAGYTAGFTDGFSAATRRNVARWELTRSPATGWPDGFMCGGCKKYSPARYDYCPHCGAGMRF